ncbi:hypothetical protein [Helicobacter anatolicus]|uniref:hypothetical protein n=1 Tax=Helicobacter anatolicus TaxID=2905874 RepID=UPI001E4B9EA3|nr:hypothetical protein [Helicobacter anatolicus]MCE3040036.1 hypothetical protein [Helicobacter anatolicus]
MQKKLNIFISFLIIILCNACISKKLKNQLARNIIFNKNVIWLMINLIGKITELLFLLMREKTKMLNIICDEVLNTPRNKKIPNYTTINNMQSMPKITTLNPITFLTIKEVI